MIDHLAAGDLGRSPDPATILVVEDEVLIRLMIAEELRDGSVATRAERVDVADAGPVQDERVDAALPDPPLQSRVVGPWRFSFRTAVSANTAWSGAPETASSIHASSGPSYRTAERSR